MDLKRKLVLFTRIIRIVVYLYVLIQLVILRDRFDQAKVIPVVVGMGVFCVIIDQIVFHVPEKRFRLACASLLPFEMFLISLLVYFTRTSPIMEFDFLYALPVVNMALWFGVGEGIAFGVLGSLLYLLTAAFSGRLPGPESLGMVLSRCGFYLLGGFVTGYMAEFAERESREKAQRMVELTALSGFATLFDSTLSEERVYENLCEAVSRSVNPDVALVFRLDQDGERLSVVASQGVSSSEAAIVLPRDYGLVGKVFKSREPMMVRDTDLEWGYRQFLDTHRIRSALYAPMKWRDEVYGVVFAGNHRKDSFTHNDLNLVSALSVQAAVAVHNSRLYADLQNRIGELHAIFEIDKAITSAIDLQTVLQQIVQMSMALLNAKTSSIMLLDEETQELVIAAAHGLSDEYLNKGPIRVGESVAGKVIQEGRPIAVKDIREDPLHAYPEHARREGLCSLLSVPLSLKDRVIGALNLYTEEPHSFTSHEINLFTSLASQAAIAIENARLFESLEEIYIQVITALANAIDARDAYTHGHSNRVMEYSVALAEGMGLSPDEVDVIRHASILHDVGKIGIREKILKKPGLLTEEERREMEYHPFIGTRILQSVRLLEPVMPLVYHHHERYDGSGYPDGLKGEEIPLGSRIIAVADAFESMTSDRPYRKALPLEEALAELRRGAGTQFDPRVVEIFLRLVEEGRIKVRRSDSRLIHISEHLGKAGSS
ncbi:MAG: GAF domain-containing protein [Actinomycetota bacterium]